ILLRHRHSGAHQTACCFAHGGEGLRQNLLERFRRRLAQLHLDAAASIDAAQLVVDFLARGRIRVLALSLLEVGDARFELARQFADATPEFLGLLAELLFRNGLQTGVMLVDLVDERLNALALPIVTSPEYTAYQ